MKWYEAVAEMVKGKVTVCDGIKYRIVSDKLQNCLEDKEDVLWVDIDLNCEDMRAEWSEYIEPLKEGDWVKRDYGTVHIGKVKAVHETCDKVMTITVELLGGGITNWTQESVTRMTPEEVEQERERRKWAAWGRKVNEYRKGDIVYCGSMVYLQIVESTDDEYVYFDDNETLSLYDSLTMICPREQRVDNWREEYGLSTD